MFELVHHEVAPLQLTPFQGAARQLTLLRHLAGLRLLNVRLRGRLKHLVSIGGEFLLQQAVLRAHTHTHTHTHTTYTLFQISRLCCLSEQDGCVYVGQFPQVHWLKKNGNGSIFIRRAFIGNTPTAAAAVSGARAMCPV